MAGNADSVSGAAVLSTTGAVGPGTEKSLLEAKNTGRQHADNSDLSGLHDTSEQAGQP